MGDSTLVSVVDLERLHAMEEEFSDATTLGIITVDARGVPVTSDCGFSQFCLEIRKDPIRRMRCYSCDAHGGLEAAIEGKPQIYRCHTGLIDFSVPIIINDQYVGAILCGQVKVDQADDPEYLWRHDQSWHKDPYLRDLYDQVTATNIRKVQAAAATLLNLSHDMVQRVTSSVTLPLGVPDEANNDDSLQALVKSLGQEDLPQAVRMMDAYLDELFADDQKWISFDQMRALDEELLSVGESISPIAKQGVAEAIRRHEKKQRNLDRYTAQIHAETLLHILYDAMLGTDPNKKHTMFALLNTIERYPTRVWTLKDAADYLGISLSHASKTFKSYTGVNFVTYVSDKRIERAKLMVAHTEQPIVRIAKELGFLPNYFSRIFKANTGMSPSEYRERFQVRV